MGGLIGFGRRELRRLGSFKIIVIILREGEGGAVAIGCRQAQDVDLAERDHLTQLL
jgi:hypothetical protein